MKTFKKIDCWVSARLICSFLLIALIRQDETFFIGYFVVGGWHIISMVTHFLNEWFTERRSQRWVYHWIVFWVFILSICGMLITPILVLMAYLMLLISPFMAIYYTWLCFDEVYVKMRRPISLLK